MQKIALFTRRAILTMLACTLALSNSAFADMSYSYRSLQDMLWVDDECSTASGVSGSAPSGTLDGDPESGYGTTPGVNKHLFIIVHTTEGDSLGAATEALKSKGYSYHTLIEKDGKETRLISDDANAKGAGGANTNSLQVSLVGMVGADGGSHFDPKSPQLQTLSKRIGDWATKYKIPLEKVAFSGQDNTHGVLGHIDVSAVSAASQGHTDPGKNFPWAQVLANAKAGGGDTSALSDVSSSSSSGSSSGGSCCPSSSGSAGTAKGDGGGCGIPENDKQENKDQVWAFFNKKFAEAGYSPEEAEKATAGIMGNWQQESAFNPARSDGMGCTEYAAFGIAQWCGKGNGDRHGDRIQKLEEYAKSVGQKPTCLGAQLEFAWKEMGDKHLQEAMKGTSPKEAAHIFNLGGKGAGGFEVGADDDKRQGFAEEQYTKYTGKSPGSLGTRSADSCASSSAAGGSTAEVAKQMGEWGTTGETCYDKAGGHGTLEDLQERIDHKFSKGYGVDCSGFTRAVIYKSTGKDPGGLGTDAMCTSDLYEKIPRAQAQPGDLAIQCTTHVEVITDVNSDGSFKTVGSHSEGCGPGKGPSPANYQGTESFVLRFKGGSIDV